MFGDRSGLCWESSLDCCDSSSEAGVHTSGVISAAPLSFFNSLYTPWCGHFESWQYAKTWRQLFVVVGTAKFRRSIGARLKPPWNLSATPVVCSTDRSKAVVPVLVLLFVDLCFILRGNLLYVFPCVILFLCFSVLLVLRLSRLGKRELTLVLFVRLFGFCLFRFVGFLFLLGSGKGCGLWLWHSLDFSLTFFT